MATMTGRPKPKSEEAQVAEVIRQYLDSEVTIVDTWVYFLYREMFTRRENKTIYITLRGKTYKVVVALADDPTITNAEESDDAVPDAV